MDISAVKIVSDSSSDTLSLDGIPFANAALKIITDDREYVDDHQLNVIEMVHDLAHYSGPSGTACPSVGDWLNAFGDAEWVFCVAITSGLSGSYNSAVNAAQTYEEEHPGRKVCVIDSLSAGPELRLILEKLRELILAGKEFDEIKAEIANYQQRTGLLFMLESLTNLANNGRVSKLAAKAVGVLGIRVLGKASDQGTLEQLNKCRGEKHALPKLVELMRELGHCGGKVRIAHCFNGVAAKKLKEILEQDFPSIDVDIYAARGLVSFYAEKGGLLVGFEKG